MMKLLQGHAHREPVTSHVHGGHHTAVSQLRVDKITIEICCGQRVIGLDAAHEVQLPGSDVGDEINKLIAELFGERRLVLLRATSSRGDHVVKSLFAVRCVSGETVD